MESKVGIWLDKERAIVVSINDLETDVTTVISPYTSRRPKGGARSKVPYGPMDKIKEKSLYRKENQDMMTYFSDIYELVKGIDHVWIMGPAQAKNELVKYIEGKPDHTCNILSSETADKMTENQIVAKIKSAFRHI